ncbi:MAG: peptide chain release factor 2 [Clostridia bacterium]|nr:peptide chain release factor 2 [Clostridia bacterium]
MTATILAVTVFDLPKLSERKNEIDKLLTDPAIYGNLNESIKLNKELACIQTDLETLNSLGERIKFVRDGLDECGDDAEMLSLFEGELLALEKDVDAFSVQTLLSGEYDSSNAILKIHSGAGGTEACDWVQMLARMYKMYAEKQGYKVVMLDSIDGDGAGFKSITFEIIGERAYGYLKGEMGVHRLVRISPFDANKRRHTSFASVEVMPEIENDTEVEIRTEDLKVDVYRSSGAGGQHVNTTDSAVRITHLPTGIVVACQNERSQIQNREKAMQMLKGKLVALKLQEQQNEALRLKGESKKIEWGSQIRSYVFCPYTLVKDHRTGYETSNLDAVMDGKIDEFIVNELKWSM